MAIKVKKISRRILILFLALFSFVFAFGVRLILGNKSQVRLSTLDKQADDVFKEYASDNVAHADTPPTSCGGATTGCGDSSGGGSGGDGSGDGY